MYSDTIVAISTASLDNAISIIRLSGDDAIDLVNKMFSGDLLSKLSHTINYGFIVEQEEQVDEVLVSVFKAPKTFTREDIVEINCHGGKYITHKILNMCISNGARVAMPGEFSQRAFINGRIDLTQAEAINEIINADSDKNAKMAINGINGSIKKIVDPLIDELLEIIANIEVNIDYPEYDDITMLTNDIIKPKLINFKSKLIDTINSSESGRIMSKGVKTAIIGKPNVGKSSLLNNLIKEDKAIVTNIEGTTRDLVEGVVNLQNVTLHLIDTAGIRETEDVIEKIGIEKTMKVINDAEIIILMLDASQKQDDYDNKLLELCKDKNVITVYNKSDLVLKNEKTINISILNNDVISLINEINNRYQKHVFALTEPTINNDRQIGLLKKSLNSCINAITALDNEFELDLVTIDIKESYIALCEILGTVGKEDLLNSIFSKFCLGK